MTSRRGRGNLTSANHNYNTRSRTNSEPADGQQHRHDLDEEEDSPGVSFDNPLNPEIQSEVQRALRGLEEINRSRAGSCQGESVTVDQVQKMIDQSNSLQTERLVEMFNKVLIEQLSAFNTPPHAFGFTNPSTNTRGQFQLPTQFNDSNFENNLPRQTLAPSNTRNTNFHLSNQRPSASLPQPHNSQDQFTTNITNLQNNSSSTTPHTSANVNTQISHETRNLTRSSPSNMPQAIPSALGNNSNIGNPFNIRSRAENNMINNIASFPSNPINHSAAYCDQNFQMGSPNYTKRGLNDWDLKFDGSSSVERFIMKVNIIRQANNLPWPYVVSQFHCLIKKPADRWYWSWVCAKHRENVNITWELLREALISHFGSIQSDEDITRLLNDKKQKPSQKFFDFFEEFMTIHDALRKPKDDIELIKILKRNVSNRLFQFTYNIRSTSLEFFKNEVCILERDLDNRYESNAYLSRTRDGRRINELLNTKEEEGNSEDNQNSVEEFKLNGYNSRDRNNTRNSTFQKESKDIYCFKCGNPGFTVTNCPKCLHPENFKERGNGFGTSLSDKAHPN